MVPPPPHEQVIAVQRRSAKDLQDDSPASQDFDMVLNGGLDAHSQNPEEGMVGLDPDVLSSLVIQLRSNLVSANAEREELISALAFSQTIAQEAEKEKERGDRLELELAECWKKNAELEEVITRLRGNLEESRNAVLRLQAESRRLSSMSVATGPASMSKRTSLQLATAPLPLRNHSIRRESHMSDSSLLHLEQPDTAASEPATFPHNSRASRRQSSLYIRPHESLLNPLAGEMESLRSELISVRLELAKTKQDLSETKESKEAGEVCVKGLKEFIDAHSIGEGSLSSIQGFKLPPLPTDDIPEDDVETTPVATGKKAWGLGGLWSAPPSGAGASTKTVGPPSSFTQHLAKLKPTAVSVSVPRPAQLTSFVSSWSTGTKSVAQTPSADYTSPVSSTNSKHEDSYTPAPSIGSYKRSSRLSTMSTSSESKFYDISTRNSGNRRTSILPPPRTDTPSLTDGETGGSSEPNSPEMRRISAGSGKLPSLEEGIEGGRKEAEARLEGRLVGVEAA